MVHITNQVFTSQQAERLLQEINAANRWLDFYSVLAGILAISSSVVVSVAVFKAFDSFRERNRFQKELLQSQTKFEQKLKEDVKNIFESQIQQLTPLLQDFTGKIIDTHKKIDSVEGRDTIENPTTHEDGET